MQGTANMVEDARQPPYLCPVDLAKVLRATGADEEERYEKLLKVCKKHDEAHLLRAFGAWIRERIEISTEN
jgi:archaemetzincin